MGLGGAVGIATAMLTLAALTGIGSAAPGKAQAKPVSTSLPTIEGDPRVGNTLAAGNGLWANAPTSFMYEWERCDGAGKGCVPVAGSTSKTYKLGSNDVGNTLVVIVTALNADGATSANSKPSEVVAANAAPALKTRPTISGKVEVGEQLTASTGEWTNAPKQFSYQWLRCDANGANCVDVADATSKVYGVRSADREKTLRVSVRATNPAGSAESTSDRTQTVGVGGSGSATLGAAIAIADMALPNRLIVSGVRFEPSLIQSRSVPVIGRFRVTDLKGRPVAGALVYAIGVPANRVSLSGERATDADGWATFTYQVLPRMELRRGAVLVFFVRARKAGENVLAGVSTRRLVSVRVSPSPAA